MRSMRLSPTFPSSSFQIFRGFDCMMMLIVFNCNWRRIIKSPLAWGEAPIWEIILILYSNIPRFLVIIYNNYYLQNGTYTHATAGCRIVDIRVQNGAKWLPGSNLYKPNTEDTNVNIRYESIAAIYNILIRTLRTDSAMTGW